MSVEEAHAGYIALIGRCFSLTRGRPCNGSGLIGLNGVAANDLSLVTLFSSGTVEECFVVTHAVYLYEECMLELRTI